MPFSHLSGDGSPIPIAESDLLEFIVENEPNTEPTDSPDNDSITTATYLYDLELDASGNIIGGGVFVGMSYWSAYLRAGSAKQ